MQPLPAERSELAAAPVGEEAAEADAHKAARQGVEQKPPQKFLGGHRHEELPSLRAPGMVVAADTAGNRHSPRNDLRVFEGDRGSTASATRPAVTTKTGQSGGGGDPRPGASQAARREGP